MNYKVPNDIFQEAQSLLGNASEDFVIVSSESWDATKSALEDLPYKKVYRLIDRIDTEVKPEDEAPVEPEVPSEPEQPQEPEVPVEPEVPAEDGTGNGEGTDVPTPGTSESDASPNIPGNEGQATPLPVAAS